MTSPQLEALVNTWRRLRDTGAGLEEFAALLGHPAADLRSTAAFLLARLRQLPGVSEVLDRIAAESSDAVVRHFAARPAE